ILGLGGAQTSLTTGICHGHSATISRRASLRMNADQRVLLAGCLRNRFFGPMRQSTLDQQKLRLLISTSGKTHVAPKIGTAWPQIECEQGRESSNQRTVPADRSATAASV